MINQSDEFFVEFHELFVSSLDVIDHVEVDVRIVNLFQTYKQPEQVTEHSTNSDTAKSVLKLGLVFDHVEVEVCDILDSLLIDLPILPDFKLVLFAGFIHTVCSPIIGSNLIQQVAQIVTDVV